MFDSFFFHRKKYSSNIMCKGWHRNKASLENRHLKFDKVTNTLSSLLSFPKIPVNIAITNFPTFCI